MSYIINYANYATPICGVRAHRRNFSRMRFALFPTRIAPLEYPYGDSELWRAASSFLVGFPVVLGRRAVARRYSCPRFIFSYEAVLIQLERAAAVLIRATSHFGWLVAAHPFSIFDNRGGGCRYLRPKLLPA